MRAVVYGLYQLFKIHKHQLWDLRISSKLIFASCLGYFYLVLWSMKQNKDAVWSLVLLLVTGVRANPKYSYFYDIICMYLRIVTFDFSLKYVIHFFSRYSRYDLFFGFNNMRRNTCPSDFVRYQAKTWKQPRVAFRGQGDAAVRQIARMNYSYGYTIVNCVWPHYGSISQLAGVYCDKLTADAGWRRIRIYVGQITIYVLCTVRRSSRS